MVSFSWSCRLFSKQHSCPSNRDHLTLLGQKEPEMPSISFDKFTWDIAQKVPAIILKPGETYRQGLSLKVAFDEAKRSLSFAPGEYKVTFGTNFQILVGEKGGRWAEFSPIRISVSSTAICNITQ
jgi:hypothetical protein